MNPIIFIPIVIYIIAILVEQLKKRGTLKRQTNRLDPDNLFIYRYGPSVLISTAIIYELITHGYTLFLLVYLVTFSIATYSTVRNYRKYYEDRHIYFIRIKETKKETFDLLRELSKKDRRFDIRYPGYGLPKLVIQKQYFDKEESIVELIRNIEEIF